MLTQSNNYIIELYCNILQSNLKIQATRMQHEIEDLQRRVENVKMKLTSEMKVRNKTLVLILHPRSGVNQLTWVDIPSLTLDMSSMGLLWPRKSITCPKSYQFKNDPLEIIIGR